MKSRNKQTSSLSKSKFSENSLQSNIALSYRPKSTKRKMIFSSMNQKTIDNFLSQNLPFRPKDEYKQRNIFMTNLKKEIKKKQKKTIYHRFCQISTISSDEAKKTLEPPIITKRSSICPKVYSPSSIYPSTIDTNYPTTIIKEKKNKTIIKSPKKERLIESYQGQLKKRRQSVLFSTVTKIPAYHRNNNLSTSSEHLYSALLKQMKDSKRREEEREKKKQTEKTDAFVAKAFKSLKIKIKKRLQFALNTLNYEIETEFGKKPTLAEPSCFDEKFRYLCKGHIQVEEPKKDLEPKLNINDILNNYSLRKEVKTRVNRIQGEENQKRKKILLEKWKRSIISAAIHFKRLCLSLEDFRELHGTNVIPYEHEKSFLLFQAIKDGDMRGFTKLFKENKFLIHDFDHFHQNTLHWMAKRNRYQMMSIAIKNGVSINAEDYAGRTPLYLASLLNNVEAVMILLYELANPFNKDKDGLSPMDVAKNQTIIYMFKRTTLLYFFHSMGKIKTCIENVRRGLLFLYEKELKLDFSKEKFLRED